MFLFDVNGLVMKTCQLFVLDKGTRIPNISSESVESNAKKFADRQTPTA